MLRRALGPAGTSKCSAAAVGTLLAVLLLGCGVAPPPQPPAGLAVHVASAPDPPSETSCAWFGDARDGVLYFGVSAFWSALRSSGGDPTADLRAPGPRWIGRFDLARERFLPPLALRADPVPSGVWDVLAHPNGRIYFTTYFDVAGSVDPESGAVVEFVRAGLGLNELALDTEGRILVTRYGYGGQSRGSLVVLSEAGEPLAEHALASPPGRRAAAKSVAFDPLRRETWVNTDLLPAAGDGAMLHDARVLAPDGSERLAIAEPEIQFLAFARDGTGFFAEAAGGRLWLRVRWPSGSERLVPLDDAFDAAHDFVQELRLEPDGRAVATRWSGRVHVLEVDGRVRELVLPRGSGELYYTGTLAGSRLCATRCGRVEVVCQDLPPG
jgi:hypothetical protein